MFDPLVNRAFEIRKTLTELQDTENLTRKAQSEVNQEVTHKIRQLGEEVEVTSSIRLLIVKKLTEEVQEMNITSVERQLLGDDLELHKTEVQNLKALLRTTNIYCAANREKQQKKEREALFSNRRPEKTLKNPFVLSCPSNQRTAPTRPCYKSQ
jgi:hypothetical protein